MTDDDNFGDGDAGSDEIGDDLDQVATIYGPGGGVLGDRDYLASRGVRISLQGHQPIMAAVEATYATLKALRDGTPPDEIAGKASPETMKSVTRDADYQRWMSDFLS